MLSVWAWWVLDNATQSNADLTDTQRAEKARAGEAEISQIEKDLSNGIEARKAEKPKTNNSADADLTDAGALIGDLLADLLSYAEAGLDRGETHESIDLNMIFEKVKQNLKVAIEESSAVLTSEHLPDVEGQEMHFVQLFQNLIGNAIKHRGERPLRIHVSAEKRKSGWRFAVADNGMGIAREYHRQIFGVFKRLHGQAIPGTGMGLAICQRVVGRYGGRLWVESQVDQGATFYFTLRSGGNR